MDRTSLLLLLGSAAFNTCGSTMMKYAYGGDTMMISSGWIRTILRILFDPWTFAGLSCFGISFLFMGAALSRTDLTLAYPLMSGLVYIFLLFVGILFLHEHVTALRLGGMALILAGIVLLTMKS